MKAEILKQGIYFNFVRRLSEDEVLSEACCIESNFEGSAALIFNPASFKVKDESWGIHHAPNPERRGEGKIPDIIGLSAYADDREISSKKINEMYEFQFENIRRKVKLKDKGVFQYIPLQIMY